MPPLHNCDSIMKKYPEFLQGTPEECDKIYLENLKEMNNNPKKTAEQIDSLLKIYPPMLNLTKSLAENRGIDSSTALIYLIPSIMSLLNQRHSSSVQTDIFKSVFDAGDINITPLFNALAMSFISRKIESGELEVTEDQKENIKSFKLPDNVTFKIIEPEDIEESNGVDSEKLH